MNANLTFSQAFPPPIERSDIQPEASSAAPGQPHSQLFSSFVALAAGLPRIDSGNQVDFVLEHLRLKDVGVIAGSMVLLGTGTSFMVYALSDSDEADGQARYVFKRTVPLINKPRDADASFQARVRAMMLELRTLAHPPINKHENIVKLLGLAWETDHFDITRKWPVFVVERATGGTLADLLQSETVIQLDARLNLMLDTVLGLEVLHACGIIHGDIKLENVLVFGTSGASGDDRPFIAKLADFSSAMFNPTETSRLSSGTWPWNAPEWRDQLYADGLRQTDVYSLGFTLWRLLANGKHPFLGFNQGSNEAWGNQVDSLKVDDEAMRNHFLGISGFETDMENHLSEKIIKSTLRRNPVDRNIAEAKNAIINVIRCPRDPPDFGGLAHHQYQLRDTFLPYSFQGVMHAINPTVVSFISKELARAAETLTTPQEIGEAKYGLAVLSMNRMAGTDERSNREEICSSWLRESAEAGCAAAQAVIYRFCVALDPNLLIKHASSLSRWMLVAISKGYFQPVEDIRLLGLPEVHLEDALRTLRFRYGGIGVQRFDSDCFPIPSSTRAPWHTSSEQIQNFDAGVAATYRRNDVGYIQAGTVSSYGDSILHLAASSGLRKTVSYLVAKDPDNINHVGVGGETPLLLACQSGQYWTAMELLEAGADPNISSHSGETPLHWLLSFDPAHARDVCQHIVPKLQGNGLNAIASEVGYIFCGENKFVSGTPLMRAVSRNRLEVVQVLLDSGADPSSVTADGTSALGLAAQLHYPHILEVFLGNIPRASLGKTSEEGSHLHTMLFNAICGGSVEAPGTLFARIRRHGVRWRDRAEETLRILLRLCSEENPEDAPGWPRGLALAVAARDGQEDIVRLLLEQGCQDSINEPARILVGADSRCTPVMAAILSKNFPAFQLLVERGADIKRPIPGPVPHTLLYECARHSHDETRFARMLIDSGVRVDESPAGYETPFACALRSRCFGLAEFLWGNGADVNIEYTDGNCTSTSIPLTVLGHLITEYNIGALACLRFLLRRRAGRSAADFIVSRSLKLSALHLLAMAPYHKQNDASFGVLLGWILDYFAPSREELSAFQLLGGQSALHIATAKSNAPVVRGLLAAGADPNVKSELGYTPLEVGHYVVETFSDTFDFGNGKVSELKLKVAKEKAEDVLDMIERACSGGQS